jgi:hypothetical protein
MASQSVSCHDLYPEAKHSVFCPPVTLVLSTRRAPRLKRKRGGRRIHLNFIRGAAKCAGRRKSAGFKAPGGGFQRRVRNMAVNGAFEDEHWLIG